MRCPRSGFPLSLSQYKILFLPFPVMLSKNVAEGVVRFIQNGGSVVAEARLAWNDERDFSSEEVPGMGLAAVFGARAKVIRPMEKPEIVPEPSPTLPGWTTGTHLTAEAFEEELEPLSDHQADARIAIRVPWKVRYARSLNDEQKVAFSQSEEGLILTQQLSAGSLWVVRYDRK
jgi:hypothetical protein